MISILIVLFTATLLAYYAEYRKKRLARNAQGQLFWYEEIKYHKVSIILIILLFTCFAGLRTSYNDTHAYRVGFSNMELWSTAFDNFNYSLGNNPGFKVCNIAIKTFISDNSQVLVFLFSFFSIVPLIFFYKRWSAKFWLTVYLFVTSGLLLFSMGAMKQFFAMGVGVYGITLLLTGHRLLFVFCILLGSTFHPYLLIYLVAFFLQDKVWSKKIILIIFAAVLCGIFIGKFLELAYTFTEHIGENYRNDEQLTGRGMSIYRFLVYCVTPILSYLSRDRINRSNNKADILFCNLSLIGFCFIFIALFANANMFGRMGNYFDPFMHIALVSILMKYSFGINRRFLLQGCLLGYLLYCAYDIYNQGFIYNWIFG